MTFPNVDEVDYSCSSFFVRETCTPTPELSNAPDDYDWLYIDGITDDGNLPGSGATKVTCGVGTVYDPATNSCVDAEEQIINELTGKALCVYDRLENNDLRNKTIDNFNGENYGINLILKLKSLPGDDAGETLYGLGNDITINLDPDYMNDSPSLFVALVILHESIHAHLFNMIKSRSGLYYNSTLDRWELPNGSRADFPTLFDYYNSDPSNAQHNYMADFYRNALIQGMKDYANYSGLVFDDQLYKDLSWTGLQGTNAFKKMYSDPIYNQQEKDRINNAIINFLNSGTNECN